MSGNPKICLIYTGGTVGMIEENSVLRPPEDPSDFLKTAPELEDIADIELEVVLNKDSTNVNHHDWQLIAEAIHRRRNDGFGGFVVAHGTDTMHFTASALAFAFGPDLNYPIVLTGAQTIPAVTHGDARVNLLRAARTALEPIAEVCIAFGDYVWRGCRSQKKDERRFDAFESPAFPPLAYITEIIDIQPLAKRTELGKNGDAQFRPGFANGIFQVSLIPGLQPSMLESTVESDECKGLILQSFGAGNVPDAEGYSFEDLVRFAVSNEKPVIITSQFPANSTLETEYAPGLRAQDAGAIPTGNMTAAAAVAKFRWVLSLVEKELESEKIPADQKLLRVSEWMQRKYVGELGGYEESFSDPDPRAFA